MNQLEIQYKNYPAMICLIKETETQGRIIARRHSLSVANEYDTDLKQFIHATNQKLFDTNKMSVGLVIRIIKNIRREYLKRVDASVRLSTMEKNWLKNYIIGKYRDSIKPFIGQA